MSDARHRRWWSLALVLALALTWIVLGPWLRVLVGAEGPGPAERADTLRVVSWNLANFEGQRSGHDLARIREVIAELDPDVIALQEIKDPEALAELLPEFELAVSDQGGRGDQRVGIGWRGDRVSLLHQAEQPRLSLDGYVRPGLLGYLRGTEGGPDFWLLVVHLKAMPTGIELRRQQWPILVEVAEASRVGATAGRGDPDLLIVGDFNTTGPPGSHPEVEQRELATILAPAELRQLVNATGCTAYYDGRRRDAWKQPSEIDLVWARALVEALPAEAAVTSGTHCAARRCQDFRSTDAYPVRDYEFVSDHCPVVVDLVRADDD